MTLVSQMLLGMLLMVLEVDRCTVIVLGLSSVSYSLL